MNNCTFILYIYWLLNQAYQIIFNFGKNKILDLFSIDLVYMIFDRERVNK